MKKKTAVIFGISGQDGAYLAHLLLQKKYNIIGFTRNISKKNLFKLNRLKIINKIKIIKGTALDQKILNNLIKNNSNIKEIYYLAGGSSVLRSFENPDFSLKSNTVGILNILMTVKKYNNKIKIFNASSGQFFGNNKKNYYNEKSVIDPQSPYGVAKAAGHMLTKIYRESYNLYCCSGILFNHESPLRSDEFVTKKIINTSIKIKKNKKQKLYLGNIDIYRDWGWAPEYVNAMWLMLQQKKPIDLVIGTGKKYSIRDFVDEVFKLLKIKKNRLKANTQKFQRKTDINSYRADIKLIQKKLKWKPKVNFKEIVFKMVNNILF
tara:strand:- start:1078 stop:2040 length:963 start_codon:yes stop_codon:yes gene_type:complete